MSAKKAWYREGAELLDEIKNTEASEDELAIWYLGQCGFAIKKQKIIYIDPVLNDISDQDGRSRRLYAPPFAPELACADYVLCTHQHIDHMAEETLLGIYKNNRDVRFILPGVCIDLAVGWGIPRDHLIEAGTKSPLVLPGFAVRGISTAHPTHRREADGKEWSLAYDLEISGMHLLHMGDTYLTEQLLGDLKQLPPPNVLFTPINGSDHFRDRRDIIGNMSARESAYLADELSADLTIPMHYDMIMGNTCNPLGFLEELWEIAPARRAVLPVLGERVIYRKGSTC